MKLLVVHTLYKQWGGEDQVFRAETLLLSSSIDVVELCYDNSGNFFSTALRYFFGLYNLSSVKRIQSVIRKEKPDVIHIHNWFFAASPSIIIAAKKMNIPVIVTLHNYRLLCPSGALFFNGKVFEESLKGGFPWKAVAKRVYRNSVAQTFWLAFIVRLHIIIKTWSRVDKFIALTPFARNLFLKSDLHLKEVQIDVKSNFVTDRGFATTNRSNKFLFVGRLSEEKGIDVLLNAFSNTDIPISIIGDGPLKGKVQEACSRHRNIVYKGPKKNFEIIEEMKSSTALILASICHEGMPITILEAFSTGTPVIASRLGAMESLVGDGENGFLFEAGNEKDLLAKVQKWSSMNQQEAELFCLRARHHYEANFTPQVNLQNLLSIYKSVLK